MKKITKEEWNRLREANLLRDKIVKNGIVSQDPNYYVANKEHNGKSKTYYIVEEYKIMAFLGYIDNRKPKKRRPNRNNYDRQ